MTKELSTEISVSESVFGKEKISQIPLMIDALRPVEIAVDFPEEGEEIRITYKHGDKPRTEVYRVKRGEMAVFNHKFDITVTRVIEDGHIFPLHLEFNSQEYKLSKTKNGKLLLTK